MAVNFYSEFTVIYENQNSGAPIFTINGNVAPYTYDPSKNTFYQIIAEPTGKYNASFSSNPPTFYLGYEGGMVTVTFGHGWMGVTSLVMNPFMQLNAVSILLFFFTIFVLYLIYL